MAWKEIVLEYICPSMGCLMASLMFAAPVRDLRGALVRGSLGALNPFPWSMMTGNCLGWVVYGYYVRDAFVVAANMPGLVLSIWLNSGAAKLQYLELSSEHQHQQLLQRQQQQQQQQPQYTDDENENGGDLSSSSREQWDAARPYQQTNEHRGMDGPLPGGINNDSDYSNEVLIMVPQEQALLRTLSLWAVVIVWVGWFTPNASNSSKANIIGTIVNINLIFFYAAPLRTMWTVISERNSESIHVPSMVMNWLNTTFWIAYGMAVHNIVIIIPNACGLTLGLLQGVLCVLYGRKPSLRNYHHSPLQQQSSDLPPPLPEEEVQLS